MYYIYIDTSPSSRWQQAFFLVRLLGDIIIGVTSKTCDENLNAAEPSHTKLAWERKTLQALLWWMSFLVSGTNIVSGPMCIFPGRSDGKMMRSRANLSFQQPSSRQLPCQQRLPATLTIQTATSVTIYDWSTKVFVQRVRCPLLYATTLYPKRRQASAAESIQQNGDFGFSSRPQWATTHHPTLHLLEHQVVDVLRHWKWLGRLEKLRVSRHRG